jgi:chromosomal replication initiator protein
MLDYQKLWVEALGVIEKEVSPANFGTWFKNTRIARENEGVVYIGVPNLFVKDWLYQKYHKMILRSVRLLLPEVRAVEYSIVKNEPLPTPLATQNTFQPQPPLQELYTNKEDGLNPRYVFGSYVVGSFNELAHAAAQAVSQRIGSAYNPLFIYGGTGLGKTHLIQSIGNHIKQNHPTKKVFYTTSEQFFLDNVNSVMNKRGNLFKEKYRKYDVLIMDDVQFLSGKPGTQEELFHLFNSFYENNKQIIFSSDKPPRQISDIEERLKSRFGGGTTVDISKPDYESRLAILKTKLKYSNLDLPLDIVELVASVVQDSIRELEGLLNTVMCQMDLKQRPLTLEEARSLIKGSLKPKKLPSLKNVMEIVASFYNINERMLYEKSRKKEVVKPRQVAMYLLREDLNTSYPYIGQKLGGRDHTTVIYAYEKIKEDLAGDEQLSQEIEQIRNRLYTESV